MQSKFANILDEQKKLVQKELFDLTGVTPPMQTVWNIAMERSLELVLHFKGEKENEESKNTRSNETGKCASNNDGHNANVKSSRKRSS